jgi:hypothetical protein
MDGGEPVDRYFLYTFGSWSSMYFSGWEIGFQPNFR